MGCLRCLGGEGSPLGLLNVEGYSSVSSDRRSGANAKIGRMSAREPESNSRNWQEWEDLNPRPAVLETAALAN